MSDACILKCRHQRFIPISCLNCQNTKVIQDPKKSKFNSNIYLNIYIYTHKDKLRFMYFAASEQHLYLKAVCRITEVQFSKVLYIQSALTYCWRLIFNVQILLLLFSQVSWFLCILSYAAEHPNFLSTTTNQPMNLKHHTNSGGFRLTYFLLINKNQASSKTLQEKTPSLST